MEAIKIHIGKCNYCFYMITLVNISENITRPDITKILTEDIQKWGKVMNNYIIVSSNYTSSLIKSSDNYTILFDQDLIQSEIEFTDNDKVYVVSEYSMDIVQSRYDRASYKYRAITTLRNKYSFRALLNESYQNYKYTLVDLDEITIELFDFNESKEYIIKPITATCAIGVRRINCKSNIKSIIESIKLEISSLKNDTYKNLSPQYIIEPFIEGTEIAVDALYDSKGDPKILNLYVHPILNNENYKQGLYYTDKKIYSSVYKELLLFFKSLNLHLNVKAFAMHAEFIILKDGTLFPIEVNPSRFGDMGLTDLNWYECNVDPYLFYFSDGKDPSVAPQQDLFNDTDQLGWILAYNGREIIADSSVYLPNHEEFKNYIGHENILRYSTLTDKDGPVFAIVYVKLNEKLFTRIKSINYDVFKTKNLFSQQVNIETSVF